MSAAVPPPGAGAPARLLGAGTPTLLRGVRRVPVVGAAGPPPGTRVRRGDPDGTGSNRGSGGGGGTGSDGGGDLSAVVDVRVAGGVVTEVAPALRPARGEEVLDADGRWLVPGLWDQHVHLTQWARSAERTDVSAATSVEHALALVRERLAVVGDDRPVVGTGHRPAGWPSEPTVAALDAVAGERRVVLVSGDCHQGWLSSAALSWLGLAPREGVVEEGEWFAALAALESESEVAAGLRTALDRVQAAAAARGVVGVVDMDFGGAWEAWPARVTTGLDRLRVRAAVYPDRLDDVLARGLRTGDPLEPTGLAEMGPLKIISDGSLNSRTASCCQPYADAAAPDHPSGIAHHAPAALAALASRARANGLEVALHAIGDAAVAAALDAFASSGASGSVEHAQLVRREDLARMAALGVRASVQPAHLLDDRDVTEQCWPDRADRCFLLASMHRAGVVLALGSDAPVSALDPWASMAAAVHRSGDDRPPWNPGEALDAATALAASTDGHGTVGVGGPGDLVLLDDDPLPGAGAADGTAAVAGRLRSVRVAATLVGGRPTHLAL